MRRSLSLGSLGALALVSALRASAQEPATTKLACPVCHEAREGARCPKDATALVGADVVVFGDTIARLAAFDAKEKGLENPFASLVAKDGLPDVAALEKLVHDYKAARAASRFTPFTGRLPLAAPAPRLTPEKAAIGALKSIATAGASYVFEAAPSSSEPLVRWFAKATPRKSGAPSYFTNQVGLVYVSPGSFSVDPRSCEVPAGLKLAPD